MSRSDHHRRLEEIDMTPDEREWIRRQGMSAQALAEEQRERLSIAEAARRLRLEEDGRRRYAED